MMHLLRKQDVTRFARNDVVFAANISEATSLGVAVTISETTSFAVRQTSLKKALAFRKCLFHGGGESPSVFNTISREMLNNAYNPRFREFAKEARKLLIKRICSG